MHPHPSDITHRPLDADFDLDLRIVESAPIVVDALRATDDNCGATCESACTSCG